MKYTLKTHGFHQWMRKTQLDDQALIKAIKAIKAIKEMTNGLVDTDLGGNLYKKRIALSGRGKSGSARTIIATNKNDRWFFLAGFEKNERDNITKSELAYLQSAAKVFLGFSDTELSVLIAAEELLEVYHD